MIVAIDVHYRADVAKAVSIEFENWEDEIPKCIHIVELTDVAEYIPGQFYKRELPCILEVLKKSNLTEIQYIILDGYVVLSDEGKMGLGAYLYAALNEKIPIIGVAKKSFHNNTKNTIELLRGESKKPLYITSIGVDNQQGAHFISQMKGDYRFPQLLKILDQKTKED